MLHYDESDKTGTIKVYGWAPDKGADDILLGDLRKDDEGFYWFHPSRKAVLCVGHLRRITQKMSDLNMNA